MTLTYLDLPPRQRDVYQAIVAHIAEHGGPPTYRELGDALGIAFQIVDDLLDYGGNSDATGKNIGDDFRERKLTLPVIKAVAQADEEERAFWKRTIEKGDQQDGDLEHALSLLAKHGAMDATREDALGWVAKAKEALGTLPEHPVRQMLMDLADYVVDRIR